MMETATARTDLLQLWSMMEIFYGKMDMNWILIVCRG